MRSEQHAAPPQDADAGGGVGKSSWPLAITRGPDVLTRMCVQADSNRCAKCKVLWAVESPLLGYNDLLGGFEGLWSVRRSGQEERAKSLMGKPLEVPTASPTMRRFAGISGGIDSRTVRPCQYGPRSNVVYALDHQRDETRPH